jgi:hypothetical protein
MLRQTNDAPLIRRRYLLIPLSVDYNETEGARPQEKLRAAEGPLSGPGEHDGQCREVDIVVREIRGIEEVSVCRHPCHGFLSLLRFPDERRDK